MSEVPRLLQRGVRTIERTEFLDRIARCAAAVRRAPHERRARRAGALGRAARAQVAPDAHGCPDRLLDVGERARPRLVAFGRAVARRLTALGIVGALPTAASGLSDWSATSGKSTPDRCRAHGVEHDRVGLRSGVVVGAAEGPARARRAARPRGDRRRVRRGLPRWAPRVHATRRRRRRACPWSTTASGTRRWPTPTSSTTTPSASPSTKRASSSYGGAE